MTLPKMIGGVVGLIGGGPVLLGQIAPPGAPQGTVNVPVWLLSMVLTAALGLVGYFLKSWLERVDSRLEKLDARVASLSTHQARVEERITALETKL